MAYKSKQRANDWQRAWRAAHPERARIYSATYDSEHREERRRKAVERYRRLVLTDSNSVRANRRKRYLASRDRAIADSRSWRQNNRERVKASRALWAARNPGIFATYDAHRRAVKHSVGGKHTTAEFREKCALLGNVCMYCGETKPLTRDHKIPLSRGGSNEITNIVPACRTCNVRKRTKTSQEFIAQRLCA